MKKMLMALVLTLGFAGAANAACCTTTCDACGNCVTTCEPCCVCDPCDCCTCDPCATCCCD